MDCPARAEPALHLHRARDPHPDRCAGLILRTPTDIFPNINIPVVSVAWQYTGLNPEELEGRLTTPYEKALTTLVDNIEHIESTTLNGEVIVKIYLQPGASLDTANAQVSAASEFMLKQLPPGILPPQIINFSASSVPILQLGLSGKGLSEQQLNDFGLNFIRPQLITVPGAVVPNVYGGKQRSIMVNLDPKRCRRRASRPPTCSTPSTSRTSSSPAAPPRSARPNTTSASTARPRTLEGLGNLPIKQVNGATVYLHDVATVSRRQHPADQHRPPGRPARRSAHRPQVRQRLHARRRRGHPGPAAPHRSRPSRPDLKITPIGDQSIFVRASINGVIREAVIAAALTGLMILLFLGSWRSTLIIAVSIPLSILTSIIVLGLIGQTINIMTLGGLALAVGILVDDATVTIENIERYLEEGHELRERHP